jgi:hypothetical protein
MPAMKQYALLTLHIIVAMCSVVSFFWVDRTTWALGGAAWRYHDAAWEARRKVPETTLNAPESGDTLERSEEKMAPFLHRARDAYFWREIAWYISLGVFLLSVLLMAIFRSKMAMLSFVVCLVATAFAFDRWGILF